MQTTITILTVFFIIASLVMSHIAAYLTGKSEGYLKFLYKLPAGAAFSQNQDNLHEEEKIMGDDAVQEMRPVQENAPSEGQIAGERKKYKFTSFEENLKSAEYSGVLHKFVRDGVRKERPVMMYRYRDELRLFEYDEKGKPLRICGTQRQEVLKAMEGEKTKNFRKYEIKSNT